ncbi:MAG: hypothetical protein HYV63_24765 [Candidatus Schekmanbacteria bacterium]|nr:hypothetical protein [Candidatus Schekmanbacteria bacterium]
MEGIEDWDEKVVTVARGRRTLTFTYTRGATESAAEGIAFVDEIRFPRHEIPATATPTPTAPPAPAPPRPELRVAFAHQGAVGAAWTPSADRRVSRYVLVRTIGTPAPALGSGWLVAAIAAVGAAVAAGRRGGKSGPRRAVSEGARFIAPGQRGASFSAQSSCGRQLWRAESRPCRVLLLSALAASAALAARAGAPAARVDAFAVDATVFTSANRLTTTFVDSAIESLELDPLDPVVTYVLSACYADGTCTRGEPVSARVDGPIPGGAQGELISDFSDPALWQPEDTGSALVTLTANLGEQGQADGLQVAIDFADDELAPAIRLAPDPPLDLSAGNAVLLDLESLDAQEPMPESALVSVEMVDRDPAAVAGGEPNPQRVALSATVPGWLRGRKLLVLPKREFLLRREGEPGVPAEESRRHVAADPAWQSIDRVVARFVPLDGGTRTTRLVLRSLATEHDPRVETNPRRLMLHYHGWYYPHTWGADNLEVDPPVIRDYPRNLGAAFYPWVLTDPNVGHYVSSMRSAEFGVSAEQRTALLQRHADWIAQSGAGTVIYSWVGKGPDPADPVTGGDISGAIGDFGACRPVQQAETDPIQGSGPSPGFDTDIETLIALLAEKGIATAFLVDATVDPPYKSPCHVVREQKGVLHTYGHQDGLFYDISRAGMPLFVTFATQRFGLEPVVPQIPACPTGAGGTCDCTLAADDPANPAWCPHLATLRGRFRANVTAQAVPPEYLRDGGFAGLNHYAPLHVGPNQIRRDERPFDRADLAFRDFRDVYAPSPLLWIPTYAAGFDKTRAASHDRTRIERIGRHYDASAAPPWDDPSWGAEAPDDVRYVSPCGDEFAFFDDFFALTLKYDPDYVGITEFNEWYEGTNIEPATLPPFAAPAPYPAGGCTYEDAEAITPAADIYDFFWRGVTDPDPGDAPTPEVAEMYLDHVREAHLPEVKAHGW